MKKIIASCSNSKDKGTVLRRRGRMKIRAGLVCLMISVVLIAGLPVFSHSAEKEKVRVVEGMIDRIDGDILVVQKKLYPITGILLIDPSGIRLSRDELQKGKKVAIYLRGKKITSVLIYDENMIE
jgi:hypothetical protein